MLSIHHSIDHKVYLNAALFGGAFLFSSLQHSDANEFSSLIEAIKLKKVDTPTAEPEVTNQHQLYLSNGDRLTGSLSSLTDDFNLVYSSESLKKEALFPIDHIIAVNLNSSEPEHSESTLARVEIQNRYSEAKGDIILGKLQELNPEFINLTTSYQPSININRSMVKSVTMINQSNSSYYGPNNISEWVKNHNENTTWSFRDGTLSSIGEGIIGKNVGLKNKTQVSFDIKWDSIPYFSLKLYSDDGHNESPDVFCNINFQHSSVSINAADKLSLNGRFVPKKRAYIKIDPNRTKKAHINIFSDPELGHFKLYINGAYSCLLQTSQLDVEKLGSHISFESNQNSPIHISNLSISSWNGVYLPTVDKGSKDTDQPHSIQLSNGDEIPGNVGKVEQEVMIVETDYTPIKIPLKRIKSLRLNDAVEQPIMKRRDVRLWLHDGGHITIQAESISDNSITGYSQAYGKISVALSSVYRIDFNIDNDEINKLRVNTY